MPTSHAINHFIGVQKIEEEIPKYHLLEAAYCTARAIRANGKEE
jgi:hypothetical protein